MPVKVADRDDTGCADANLTDSLLILFNIIHNYYKKRQPNNCFIENKLICSTINLIIFDFKLKFENTYLQKLSAIKNGNTNS